MAGMNGFLFGGIAENSPDPNVNPEDMFEATSTNDMFNLSLGSAGLEWRKLKFNEDTPTPLPRWHHSATLYDNTQLVIFGGMHSSTHR